MSEDIERGQSQSAPPVPERVMTREDEIRADILAAVEENSRLCRTRNGWRMTIPVDERRDSDRIFARACGGGRELLATVTALRAEVGRLRAALRGAVLTTNHASFPCCYLCGYVWSKNAAEWHGLGCLAAPREGK